MALKDMQRFLTHYLRDPYLRANTSREGVRKMAADYGLDEAEQNTLEEMELGYLAREAEGVIGERLEKRQGEFREFFDHLAHYASVEQFFVQYNGVYRTGLMTRPIEMDCFLSFATGFVVQNGLPPYLVDLARFNYYYSQVSITPVDVKDKTSQLKPDEELRLYHLVQLKAPYRVLQLRYDILDILRSEFVYNDPRHFTELATTLFIQKDWDKATTTQIFYTSELPLLEELVQGEISVNELLARYSVQHFDGVIGGLNHLHEKKLISVKLPKYFL